MKLVCLLFTLFLLLNILTLSRAENENDTLLFIGMPFDEELCEAKECDINKTWTSEEKCAYIKCNSDSCEGGGYFPWSQYVKCQYNIGARVVIIIAAILYLFILFLIMSVVADDFFSPAIGGIVSHLKMSESIAGVTFLAFGNGAPDVFGSISSVLSTSNPKADLALGDLFGGSIFVTLIVLSAIIFTTSFKIAIIPTIRDIIFFLVALAFIMVCFVKFDHIEVWMPATFLGIYAIYVLSVVVIHYLRKRRKLRKQQANHNDDSSSAGDSRPSRNLETPGTPEPTLETNQESSRSLYYDNIAFSREDGEGPSDFKRSNNEINNFNFANRKDKPDVENNMKEEEEVEEETLEEIDIDDEGAEAEFVISHRTVFTSHDQASLAASEIDVVQVTSWKSWSWVHDLWNHLKPWPSREEYIEMNLFSKIMVYIKAIPVFSFKLTIPANEASWCKPLFLLQCYTTIQFALFAIMILNKKPFHESPGLWLYGLGVSTIMAVLGLIFTPLKTEQRYYKEVFSYLGFLMSIAWIYITSNEIVGVLTMLGVVTGLSQELLGLTIMAWSNGIGDFVADTAVARQGFPKMAMAAAIGGPLFNLLIGFGLPFTIAAAQGKKIDLKINSVYRMLMLFLAISLITTLIAIFVQRFRVRWPHAVVLIFIFIVYLIFVCLSEFHVLEWN